MKPGKIEIEKPEYDNLWKYFDLHRFIYFLNEQKLFFTRLDKLKDPLEGVATRLLRRDAKYSKIPDNIEDFHASIPKSERKQLLNEKKLHTYVKDQDINTSQKRQYVNCWFNGDRESMAMWNLYSNSDSVAIKANFKLFKPHLESTSQNFITKAGNRASVIGDTVKYLNLNPFDEKTPKNIVKYSSLKKDVSFDYEKEYRLLIYTIEGLDKSEPFYTIPVDINKLQLTVITHPNMEDWKFQNVKRLIEIYKYNIILEKSSIIFSKNIDNP